MSEKKFRRFIVEWAGEKFGLVTDEEYVTLPLQLWKDVYGQASKPVSDEVE